MKKSKPRQDIRRTRAWREPRRGADGADAVRGRRGRALLRVVLPAMLAAVPVNARAQVGGAPTVDAFPHDSALFSVLAMEPGRAQLDSLDAYESRVPFHVLDTLAAIAEDPAVHPLLRANATLLIGRRRDLAHFIILKPLLEADDPRIRLAVVVAAQEFLPALTGETLSILRTALKDPEPTVQARALEAMTARDVDALRDYIASGPPPELRTVAEGLIRAGESRGAPLVPDDNGALHKPGPGGAWLHYRPRSRWSGSELSAGTLELEIADGRRVTLGEDVEVARNVLPAFFSVDGSRIVFENGRSIHVHDIESGATRTVGPGIAPRPLPFTDSFVYAVVVDDSEAEVRGQTRTRYALYRGSFGAVARQETAPIDTVSAVMSFGVAGGASPLRWMRVTQEDGFFSLRADGMDPVPLPDPFGEGNE